MFTLTPWEEKKRMNLQRAQRLRREIERFSRYPKPTESEARSLIESFLSQHGVTRGPSVEERRAAWGFGA